jgi:O-antigen ligase
MPAEQALTEARRNVGPSLGSGGGGSQAWRGRLEETAALIVPVALIGGLALAGGGYELGSRHIAGLAAWLTIVALLTFGAASTATVGRPFYWASGLIGGLALWSALSSAWSGSVELSVIEADRILVYLSFFIAAFLIVQTERRRQRFGEGIAIALALIAVLALASRLLPHLLSVEASLGSGPRLRYPLGYWNANGLVFGIATALLMWMSRRAGWAPLRWLAVGLMPTVLLALYFTYSRGGVLALLVATGCLIALSHDRLWMLAVLAAGAVGALPAVLAVQARDAIAENLNEPAAIGQGVTVLAILLAGTALTLLLFAALRRVQRRGGRLTGRALVLSRHPRFLRWGAIALALLGIAAAIAVGGRAWSQFSSSDVQFPSNPEQHFGDLSGAGRHDFYRVAVDAFGEEPLIGHGAGTYVFSWNQKRSIGLAVHDAHSLYLQAFAELGLVGGFLTLGLVGLLLWTGFGAWRAASGAARERNAALLAVALTFAVGAVFFLASGALVASRCAQLARVRAADGAVGGRRLGLVVGGLALAWVAAIALIGPLLVDHELRRSQEAAASGNLASAADHARTARSIEPWAASPYLQLGLVAEAQGEAASRHGQAGEARQEYAAAIELLGQAIDREGRNWQLFFDRWRVEQAMGRTAAAAADLARARELDPLAPELAEAQ